MIAKERNIPAASEQQPVVGLDIGTTKICAIAGKYDANGNIQIVGVGSVKSEGLKGGVITDIQSAKTAIRKAVDICEQKSGMEIQSVYAGIAGQHIEGFNTEGVVAVKGELISESDVERVIDSAKAHCSADKEIIHILDREYVVDGQNGVKNPIGMAGKRLQVKLHIILAAKTAIMNLTQSCEDAGLNVNRIVVEPLASAYAVLSKDERELGVVLLDIGGGTSDMIVYKNDSVIHTAVIPIGGNYLTHDISVGLKTHHEEATQIKHLHGTALMSTINEGETIRVAGIQNRPERVCEKKTLGLIIESRMKEIFELVYEQIKKGNFASIIGAGVVLTGGACLLKNIDMLSDQDLGLQSRIGVPFNVTGLAEQVSSPIYATGVGLVRYGMEDALERADLRVVSQKNQNFLGMAKSFLGKYL